jgi:hypothetical protein
MRPWVGLVCLTFGCVSGATTPEPAMPSSSDGPGAPSTSSRFCAIVVCGPNTHCDDSSGEARCLPSPSCVNHQCPHGQSCELVQLQCTRSPCPEQPACVPSKT